MFRKQTIWNRRHSTITVQGSMQQLDITGQAYKGTRMEGARYGISLYVCTCLPRVGDDTKRIASTVCIFAPRVPHLRAASQKNSALCSC